MPELTLPGLVTDLVALRHAGGYRFKVQEGVLRQFADHCRREGTGGQFRPPCNAKRPHCHVDYRNAKGEKTHTIHYYWRNWRRLK